MKFLAIIRNKEIIYKNEPFVRHHLSKLETQKVTVEVKRVFNKRSLNQNALMWIWFTLIAEHTGYSPEEVHKVVKGLYCPKKQIKLKDKVYMVTRGTSELSVGEMVELMMRIEAMAADLGIRLPTADEYIKGSVWALPTE